MITGDDGQIRGVVLNVTTNGKISMLRRPLSCLYPLEVSPRSIPSSNRISSEQMKTFAADDVVSSSRPARAATEKSRQRVLEWMTDNCDL